MQRTGWNKRLLASTRGRILALLRSENRTVNELAAALHLTDNAVRAHLLSLERDGLVYQHGTRPGKRKPHAAFGLSTEAEHVFPKAYGPLLAHFVTVLSNRLTAPVLRATMREVDGLSLRTISTGGKVAAAGNELRPLLICCMILAVSQKLMNAMGSNSSMAETGARSQR